MKFSFLKAKHWQVFTAIFSLPFISYVFLIIYMIINLNAQTHAENIDPSFMVKPMLVFIPFLMLGLVMHYIWQWKVAHGLRPYLPDNTLKNIKWFRFFVFFPIAYLLLIIGFMGVVFFSLEGSGKEPFLFENPIWGLLMIPFHLLSIFGSIYLLYFLAKTIKSAQIHREASFSEYLGEFVLLWFFPIGIWVLQPKINRLVENPPGFEEELIIDQIS